MLAFSQIEPPSRTCITVFLMKCIAVLVFVVMTPLELFKRIAFSLSSIASFRCSVSWAQREKIKKAQREVACKQAHLLFRFSSPASLTRGCGSAALARDTLPKQLPKQQVSLLAGYDIVGVRKRKNACGQFEIPGSVIPSDWSILTGFVNTRALLEQMRYAIWLALQSLAPL